MTSMRTILCFLAFLVINLVNAQTAPDFSITDSEGNSHMLFADYLDQGKTVVLEVFFTTCPPCNTLAPHLEPLYQSWGAGQGDVEFIAISTLQSDSDSKVNDYLNNHNTTFPAVGGDGGSVNAVAPYRNGTFGPYTGTPLFVVIAPDKSVNYDVFGSGIQGQIDAIDQAIEATGATGLPTAVQGPKSNLQLKLVSTLVTNELVLKYEGDPTEITLNLVNFNGQIYSSGTQAIENTAPITINVSDLTLGSWILNIRDNKTNTMQSYVFIKQ